jgi:hypothetical protein
MGHRQMAASHRKEPANSAGAAALGRQRNEAKGLSARIGLPVMAFESWLSNFDSVHHLHHLLLARLEPDGENIQPADDQRHQRPGRDKEAEKTWHCRKSLPMEVPSGGRPRIVRCAGLTQRLEGISGPKVARI